MIVAQLSDPHIVPARQTRCMTGSIPPPFWRGRSARSTGSTRLPDIVVITGDLVDQGRPAEYEHLRQLLSPLRMPVFVIPGNHDDREAAARQLSAATAICPASGFLNYLDRGLSRADHRARYADPGRPSRRRLCADRLRWLDDTLAGGAAAADAGADAPSALCHRHRLHGPLWHGGCRRASPTVIARHPQVERILCGHLHRAIDRRFAGTVAGTAPSTAHQIRLNLSAEAPLRFTFEPPGYQLHVWHEDSGLVTHTANDRRLARPLPLPHQLESPLPHCIAGEGGERSETGEGISASRPSPVSPLTRRSTLSRDAGEGKAPIPRRIPRLLPRCPCWCSRGASRWR